MNPQYRHGPSVSASGLRGGQYSANGYGDHEDDEESEAPPSYAATLESVPLGTSEENRQLLDQVDQLRACGVDEYIDLPQIVVVGDQSSGKSSVLEAVTKIPFPRKSVKCTRFATQIRLRRSDEIQTIVEIIPHKEASSEERKRLDGFRKTIEEDADFDSIFQRATDAIFSPGAESGRFLSKHILSVEKSGPDQPHLTVVDLPGFIHSPTMEQTAEDIADISALAKYYMKKERTIILPVVSGGVDISNQVVLGAVKDLDPKGIRTLGIITKPDMAETEASQTEFINLASNKDKRNKLQLGWHVLRNRKHDEMEYSSEDRNRAEAEFFANPRSNWGRLLKPNQLGVEQLSKRLSTQLIRHIAAEVFKVQADIELGLEKCRDRLAQLGHGYDTDEDMKRELHGWCEKAVRFTQAAVQGHGINPSGEDFFPHSNDGQSYARNFRSRVVIQNKLFAAQMENWGYACLIIDDDGTRQDNRSTKNDANRFPEMKRSDYINKVVRPLLDDNPGIELSMDTNPLLTYRLFQSYSRNWTDLATQHINVIHKICDDFLLEVLHRVYPPQIQTRIWRGFIKSTLDDMLGNALKEMQRLETDRLRLVTAYESEFLARYKQAKEADAMSNAPVDLAEQRYQDVLTKMLLLYESNLKTFISNVIVQVIERHIADGLEEVFHDRRVRELSKEDVRALVEDDYQVRTERQALREKESVLAQGKDICRQISMRSDLGPYEYPKYQSPSPSRQTNSNYAQRPPKPSPPSHRYNYPSADLSATSGDTAINSPVSPSASKPLRSPTRQEKTPIPPVPTRLAMVVPDEFHDQDYRQWPVDETGSLNSLSKEGLHYEDVGMHGDGLDHARKLSRTQKILRLGKK